MNISLLSNPIKLSLLAIFNNLTLHNLEEAYTEAQNHSQKEILKTLALFYKSSFSPATQITIAAFAYTYMLKKDKKFLTKVASKFTNEKHRFDMLVYGYYFGITDKSELLAYIKRKTSDDKITSICRIIRVFGNELKKIDIDFLDDLYKNITETIPNLTSKSLKCEVAIDQLLKYKEEGKEMIFTYKKELTLAKSAIVKLLLLQNHGKNKPENLKFTKTTSKIVLKYADDVKNAIFICLTSSNIPKTVMYMILDLNLYKNQFLQVFTVIIDANNEQPEYNAFYCQLTELLLNENENYLTKSIADTKLTKNQETLNFGEYFAWFLHKGIVKLSDYKFDLEDKKNILFWRVVFKRISLVDNNFVLKPCKLDRLVFVAFAKKYLESNAYDLIKERIKEFL